MKRIASNQNCWISLVAAVPLCLWALNWLPVQSVHYRLTTSIAISQHRLPTLLGMKGTRLSSKSDPTVSFDLDDVHTETTHSDSVAHSDLGTARVKVRLKERQHLSLVESILDEATIPTSHPQECDELAKQIKKEQWILETATHSLKRYDLDVAREKESRLVSADDSMETKNSVANTRGIGNPFQLSSFVTQRQGRSDEDSHRKQLESIATNQANKLESMTINLERLRAQARGYLSFTGAAQLIPIAHSITLFRLSVLLVLCVFIWLILGLWISPWQVDQAAILKSSSLIPRFKPKLNQSKESSKTPVEHFDLVGIPFLGFVQVVQTTHTRPQASSPMDPVTKENHSEKTSAHAPKTALYYDATLLLKRLGEGSLILWVALFCCRLLLDPAWRELVMVAPLAAIARMVSGIQ